MRWRFEIARRLAPSFGTGEWLDERAAPIEAVLATFDGVDVALVGNARALSEGGRIDRHQKVIRMNLAPGLGTPEAGTRLSWLVTSIDPGAVLAVTAEGIVWMTDKRRNLPYGLWRSGKLSFYPTAWRAQLARTLGARPSTGAMAVDLLRRSNLARVTLYGFDFFASLSRSGNATAESVPHDFSAEARWITGLVAADPRFAIVPPGAERQGRALSDPAPGAREGAAATRPPLPPS